MMDSFAIRCRAAARAFVLLPLLISIKGGGASASMDLFNQARHLSPICTNEVTTASHPGSNHIDLMKMAVCFHTHNCIDLALDIYSHIRQVMPNYAYVLVNIGVVYMKRGDTYNAKLYLEQYIHEVGGLYGNDKPVDTSARENGSPCRQTSSVKVDCVNALNNLAAAHLTDGKNSSSVTLYLARAIEVGDSDELMLEHAYNNLGGHLAKMGDSNGAADAYLRAFWIARKKGSNNPVALVRRALLVPTIASSLEETERTRVSFRRIIR